MFTDKKNSYPAAMAEPLGARRDTGHHGEPFVIRRLNVTESHRGYPSPLIQSAIHCFFYVVKGEALILIGNTSFLFKAGDCGTVPAGQVFSVRYYDNCTGYMGGFHPQFLKSGSAAGNLLRTFGFLRKWGNHHVQFNEVRREFVRNIMEHLCYEYGHAKNTAILKACLTVLLTEINEASQKSSIINDPIDTENRLCNHFMEMVFEQACQNISASDYASRLHVTAAHLHKTVKHITGKTPFEWITEAVLLEAKALLCNTEMTVSEISMKVGIADASYFSRMFKKNVGTTPVAYRNAFRQ